MKPKTPKCHQCGSEMDHQIGPGLANGGRQPGGVADVGLVVGVDQVDEVRGREE